MWAQVFIVRHRGRKLPPRRDGFLLKVTGDLKTVRVPGESGKMVDALGLFTGMVNDTLHLYQPRLVHVAGPTMTLRGLECTPDLAWCVQEWECQIDIDFQRASDIAPPKQRGPGPIEDD